MILKGRLNAGHTVHLWFGKSFAAKDYLLWDVRKFNRMLVVLRHFGACPCTLERLDCRNIPAPMPMRRIRFNGRLSEFQSE